MIFNHQTELDQLSVKCPPERCKPPTISAFWWVFDDMNDSDMKQLKGISLAQLDFIPEHLGDLFYQEGPILAHFVNKDNPSDHYIYRWTDMNDIGNRWLVIKVTENQFEPYATELRNRLKYKIPFDLALQKALGDLLKEYGKAATTL